MKFATKLCLLFSGIFITASVFLISYIYLSNVNILKEEIIHRIEDQAFNTMDKIDQRLFDGLNDIKTLANDQVIRSRSSTPQQIKEKLLEFQNIQRFYASVSFFDLNRLRIADTSEQGVGTQSSVRDYWLDLARGETLVLNLHISHTIMRAVIHFVCIVKDHNGIPFGVVVARMPLEEIHEIAAKTANAHKTKEDLKIDLVDREGVLLYSNYNKKGLFKDKAWDWEVVNKKITAGEKIGSVIYTRAEDSQEVMVNFVREPGYQNFSGNDWTLITYIPAEKAFAPAKAFRNRLIVIFAVIAFFSLLGINFFSRRITRPIVALERAITAFGTEKLKKAVPVVSQDEAGSLVAGGLSARTSSTQENWEIGSLAQAFDNMVATIQQQEIKRTQAEKELKLRAQLLDAASDSIFLHDRDGHFLYVNERAYKDRGYEKEDLLAKDLKMLATHEFADKNEQQIKELSIKGDIIFESAHRRKDGSIMPVEINARTIDLDNRRLVLSVARDITERKQAEETLSKNHHELQETAQRLDQSMHMLQLIIESIPVRVFWKDYDLHYLGCNTLFARDAGLNHPQQLLGKDDFAMGWKDQAGLYRADDRQVMDSRRPKLNIIEPQTTPTGAKIWLDTSKVPLQNPNGEVIGVLGIYEDITERIEAEEALRDSEEKYRGLIETTNTGYVIVDLEGKVLDANPEYVRLTGHHELNEITGRNLIEWTAKEDLEKYAVEIKNCIQQGSVKNFEVIYEGKDGRSIPVEINATIIRGSSAAKIINLVRDIADRKQAEAALRQSEEQLQQAQKMEAVGKLAGGVAHDFNNILTAISGQSELLLLDLPEIDPRRHDVQEIQRATDRAASLTRQLLAFSRKEIIQPKVLDLNELIFNLDKMLRRLIPEEVQLISIPGLNLGSVFADPGQIEQSIVNLAVNACDAMPQGGKLIIETANADLDGEYCQRHAPVKPGPYVMLAVSDTGVGMDSETQSHVFEPFFTTKGTGQGTGLGLSMVYGIVKRNGGYIWIYSEPGHGTAFKIYLPRTVEAGESGEPPKITSASFEGSETILLLEDEDMVREITRKILQKEGYVVLTASSGSEALLIGEQHKGSIHLILSDVVMQDMSGPETVGRLLQKHSEAKVIYMSGHTENAIVHRGVFDQSVIFIQKPFRRESLLGKIREILDTLSDN
jgi:two-component system cell cycle sensor histidine kinase/response regulator CckA